MTINSHWLAPSWVETPDIRADIEEYCGISFTEEQFTSLPDETQQKLRLLAERLEFVEHLLVLRDSVARMQQEKIVRKDDRVEIHYSFKLWGHELAGVHFDIDALVFYLLLTVVDTIKGQSNHHDPFEWLIRTEHLQNLVK